MVKKMVLILTMHDLSPLTGGFFFCVVNTGDVYMTKQQLADFEAKAKNVEDVYHVTYGGGFLLTLGLMPFSMASNSLLTLKLRLISQGAP